MEASEAIVRQLKWIKWLTAVVALSFALIAGSITWSFMQMSEVMNEPTSFAEKAGRLLEEGKEAEVLKAAEELEKKSPKDPNVFWYRGRAHYQLGQHREALAALRRVEELAPNWKGEYTAPYVKAIEEKLGEKR